MCRRLFSFSHSHHVAALRDPDQDESYDLGVVIANPAAFNAREYALELEHRRPSSADGPGEEPLAVFELTEDETLSIYADNVDILRFVVEKMEFDEVDIEAMHSVFDDASEGDPQRLSKQAFAQSVERLMPRGRFTSDTKVVLSRSLDGIFEAFDRAQMGFVDLKEFASAFSTLCKGGKSEKLLFAWEVPHLRQHRAESARGRTCLAREEEEEEDGYFFRSSGRKGGGALVVAANVVAVLLHLLAVEEHRRAAPGRPRGA